MKLAVKFFVLPLALVISALGVLVFLSKTDEETGPWRNMRQCPVLVVKDNVVSPGEDNGLGKWNIFVSDFHNSGPRITVSNSDEITFQGSAAQPCAMEVLKLQSGVLEGTDWRIGHTLDVSEFRGGRVRAVMTLSAKDEVNFDTAQVYMYDGRQVRGVSLTKLDNQWRQFVIEAPISKDAVSLELWLRLAIHGTISRKTTVYLGGASVELHSTGN